MTIISEPNRIFQTELNQTHCKPNLSFKKNETKPNRKKSVPHILTYDIACCSRVPAGSAAYQLYLVYVSYEGWQDFAQ